MIGMSARLPYTVGARQGKPNSLMPSALASWTVAPALRLFRAVAWLVVLAMGLGIALAALPLMVDWQAYKPRLVSLLSEATGRAVVIDGPIDLTLLPRPAVRVRGLKLGNAPGAPGPYLLEVRRVEAQLSWHALIQGRLEVTRVALDEPSVLIEPAPDGQPNWWLPLLDSSAPGQPPLVPLSVDRIEVRNGRLLHALGLFGQPIDARSINLAVRLDRAGLVHLEGSAVSSGVPITVALDLRTGLSAEAPVALSVEAPGGRLTFTGWPGQRSATDPLRGRMSLTAAFLPEFVQSLSRMLGRPPIRLNEAVLRQVEVSGDVALVGERLTIDGLDAKIGVDRIRGALQVDWAKGIAVSGRLAAATLDADRWVERLHDQPLLVPPLDANTIPPSEAPDLQFQLSVEAGSLLYRRGTVRDLSATFHVDNGVLHVQEVKAILPGDFRIHRRIGFEGDQAHPGYDGVIEVDGQNLRETLKWIGIDTSAVPADRLRTMQVNGRTRPVKGVIHVSNASFALDDQAGTVSADIALSIPTVITARLQMPRLDLDGYRLGASAFSAMTATATAPADTGGIPLPLIDISATLGQVIYRGEPAHDVDARILVRGNQLTLKRVAVGALLGSHLEISGSVSDFGTAPRFDLTWRGVLPDLDRMLDYAGLPRFINGRIGAAQIAGKATGTLQDVGLSNLSVSMLEATITAAGQVRFADKLHYDFPRWAIASHDVGTLVAVASGTRRQSLAEIRASGAFRGDEHKASFQGELVIDGMPVWGDVSSTLVARPRIDASFRAPSGLRLDRWLPAAPGSGAAQAVHGWASGAPSAGHNGLVGLRGFDGTLSLVTPAVHWGPYVLADVRLSTQLQQGVLKIDRLTGKLAEASIDLSGTVDARRDRTALEVRGSLRDIDISRTIAIAHTANDFGTDDFAVALGGKLSLDDLVMQAEGDTAQDLLLSAVANGRTEGRVRPVVSRGSLSLATLATGLGSLFSTEMGFASAVIDNFVDRWIETRGTFELANGILVLNEHTLRGPSATAYITSRIDARQGLLDTDILLDIGRPGSIDYTMSLRGPMRAPTLRSEPNRNR